MLDSNDRRWVSGKEGSETRWHSFYSGEVIFSQYVSLLSYFAKS